MKDTIVKDGILLALFTLVMFGSAACYDVQQHSATQAPQRFEVVRQYQVEAIGRTLAILRDAKTGACFIYAEDNNGNYAGAGSLTAASQDVCSEDK